MEVDYMVLADAAAAAEGKHYIHGAGFDTLWATSFPVTHPNLSIAVRLAIPWNATNHPHTVDLDAVDADGNSILPNPPGPMRGKINVGRPPQIAAGTTQYVCLAFNVVGMQFQGEGEYVVLFHIDGTEAARSAFRVSPPPGMPIPVPGPRVD